MTVRPDSPTHLPEVLRLLSLPIADLAWLWIERAARSLRGGAEESLAMADTNDAILAGGPFRVLALIREIVRTETDLDLLGYLAATLLECMLPTKEGRLLDAVEGAILEDARFADLFFDIHFNGLEGPVEDRIVAAVRETVQPRRAAV